MLFFFILTLDRCLNMCFGLTCARCIVQGGELLNVVPIDRITPYSNNPRRNNEAVSAVAASIREFGFHVPIIVDEEFIIIAGHTRLKAALELGLKEVPVHVATGLSDAQKKAYRIADNRTSELSQWDNDRLEVELSELQLDGFDLSITAFGVDEIKDILGQVELVDLPGLPDGDREPFQQMTFILHDEQVEIVKKALETAKRTRAFSERINENSNGNALAQICVEFIGQ